jgi:hypothetical protein
MSHGGNLGEKIMGEAAVRRDMYLSDTHSTLARQLNPQPNYMRAVELIFLKLDDFILIIRSVSS